MKLRVKLGRQSQLVNLEEREPSAVTLGELRQAVSSQFDLENHVFQLSLNKIDPLAGDDKPLSDFGLVSGDLLHIVGSDLPDLPPQPSAAVPARQRPQPLASSGLASSISTQNGPVHSLSVNRSNNDENSALEASGAGSSQEAQRQRNSQGGSDMDVSEQYQENEQEMAVVNRWLREPLLVRESTGRQVPILLQQLYSAAQCGNKTDALWVVVHTLMIESGFSPCECPDDTVMPEGWKKPGYYMCTYTYSIAPDVIGSCSLTGVTLGASVAVHAIPRTETGFKTDTVQLNSTHFVRELNEDVPSVYRALDKVSLQIKDSICLPVTNELVSAAGYRNHSQGLLSLPWELTLRILTYLDVPSLGNLGQTCQEMKENTRDRMVWRCLYLRDFPRPDDVSLRRSWMELYKEKQEQVREEEQRRRDQQRLILRDPLWVPPHAGPFRHLPPAHMPFPPDLLGGDYDLNPEFAAGNGMPHPFGPRGGNPLRLPRPRIDPSGLDPFSGNPLQQSGRRQGGNLTGSPFATPFSRGPFF